jgi:hypothetical protein
MKCLIVVATLGLQPVFGCLNSPMISTSLNGPTSAGHPLGGRLVEAMV